MNALSEKVAALPEIYQPIFGHQELTQKVSRTCEDRLRYISTLHDTLRQELGRQVRILDLGCAQGYISLSLASLGGSVVGVDFLAANIAVCNALAAEYPELDVRFEQGRLEDVIGQLGQGSFDLVLGLSVFHHVAHEHGAAFAMQLVDKLSACVAVGVFELALAEEPLYWAAAQPNSSRELLRGYAFVHVLATFPTHLSNIARPLYVSSNRYWYLDGNIQAFDRFETESHALARGSHQFTRRYFFGGDKLAKLVRFDAEHGRYNKVELQREIEALRDMPEEFSSLWPSLESFGQSADEGWLVRSVVEGDLLLDVIMQDGNYDHHRVIGDVLDQLVVLENYGLYHNDLRVWNVVLSRTGFAVLIDYGAVGHEPLDCTWPDDLFLAFFIFVHNTATHSVSAASPTLPPFISAFNLPAPYAEWLAPLWSRPRHEWTFQALQASFASLDPHAPTSTVATNGLDLWISASERHQAMVACHLRELTNRHEALDASVARVGAHAGALQSGLTDLEHRHEALDASVARVGAHAGALQSGLTDLEHRHEALDASVARVGAHAGALQSGLTDLEHRHEALDASVARVGAHAGALQSGLTDLEHRHEALDASVARVGAHAGALQSGLTELVYRHEVLDVSVGHVGTGMDDLSSGLIELTRQYEALDKSVIAINAKMHDEIIGLQQVLGELQGHLSANEREREQLQHELRFIHTSHSFRITRPLRDLAALLRKARRHIACAARPVWHRMVRHAWGRKIGIATVYLFPRWRARLRTSITAHVNQQEVDAQPEKFLSAGSVRVYKKLQQGMKNRRLNKER